jgi:FkbM family methyltransferase
VDNAEYQPKLLPLVLERGSLVADPFLLIDVGCGTGLDPLWRLFGDALVAQGFDANVDEVERLTAGEESQRVRYEARLVGLPEGHEFFALRERDRAETRPYAQPWQRTSSQIGLERALAAGNRSLLEANAWNQHRLATDKVALDDFVRERGIEDVDFVKVDTDGHDLEVLLSAERMLEERRVLGLLVETPFTGSHHETENNLANIDRLLRRHGFHLYSLTLNRYSRTALPAPFEHRGYAQTRWGQALWGDALYLRDAGAPDYAEALGFELSPVKLLKLACVYELFRLPDCAAEILVRHRDALEPFVDVDRALDLLTPPLDGESVSWRAYVDAFERDPASFFPPENAQPEEQVAEATPEPKGSRAARAAVAIWSRLPERLRRPLRPVVRALAPRSR